MSDKKPIKRYYPTNYNFTIANALDTNLILKMAQNWHVELVLFSTKLAISHVLPQYIDP